MNWNKLKRDFLKVARIAGQKFISSELHIEPAKTRFPKKRLTQGVYIFMLKNKCLKVGRAGPKSHSRFGSQHYIYDRTSSRLANSIISNRNTLRNVLSISRGSVRRLNRRNIGAWIERNTTRQNFLMPADKGPLALSLLEVFLQCRLKPVFEGKSEIVS
jgi:hypothetical protein